MVTNRVSVRAASRRICFNWLSRLLVLVLFAATPAVSQAMQFRVTEDGEVYASGVIDMQDAERLASLITLPFRQKHGLVRFPVVVHLDSPGGSLLGGLRLGAALREAGNVWAVVDRGANCHSACAWAFIGAVRRSVEGQYGVHASRLVERMPVAAQSGAMDTLQMLSSLAIAYNNAMVGNSVMAKLALSTSSADLRVLTDDELVQARVITDARRPSQYGDPSFGCRGLLSEVQAIVCANVTMSRQDREIAEQHVELMRIAPDLLPTGEQERWLAYRDSCRFDIVPNGADGVRWCLMGAYELRSKQLSGRLSDASTRRELPVKNSWRPIEPMCPLDGTQC